MIHNDRLIELLSPEIPEEELYQAVISSPTVGVYFKKNNDEAEGLEVKISAGFEYLLLNEMESFLNRQYSQVNLGESMVITYSPGKEHFMLGMKNRETLRVIVESISNIPKNIMKKVFRTIVYDSPNNDEAIINTILDIFDETEVEYQFNPGKIITPEDVIPKINYQDIGDFIVESKEEIDFLGSDEFTKVSEFGELGTDTYPVFHAKF